MRAQPYRIKTTEQLQRALFNLKGNTHFQDYLEGIRGMYESSRTRSFDPAYLKDHAVTAFLLGEQAAYQNILEDFEENSQ